MQDFNFHTHTYRCGHAIGKDEEYIQAAIAAGFKTLGISEHLGYEGWDDPVERIAYADIDAYIEDMYALKTKYRDQIDIYVGFEFEYFEDKIEYLNLMKSKVDYLIVGQHAKNFEYYYHNECSEADLVIYADQVIAALDAKLTKYIAHIDYFMLGRDFFTPNDKVQIERICDAVLRNDAYIEINIKGCKYRHKEINGIVQRVYPNKEVFDIVASKGCKVVFGYDAHDPKALIQRDKELLLRDEFKYMQNQIQATIDLGIHHD